jgi:hypothetical protein
MKITTTKCNYCNKLATRILNLSATTYFLCDVCFRIHTENNRKAVELGMLALTTLYN